MAVMSRQTLLFRRASINAIAKRLVTLSRTADTMSPRTRRKIDSFRSYVLHNYKQLPVAVRVLGTTVPPQRPLPLGGGGAPVKVPAAPHLAGASNPRTSLIRETISASASPSTSRASSAGSARHAAESGKQTEPPVSNNNNWNAHGRIGGGAAGGKGGNVTIASHPPEDLTGMCTFVRAKTPPHPHHFDEPNRTVPLIPDLPRRQRSLVDHHTHVGSIFVDVSFFFVGDIHAKSGLEGKVDGLQDAEVGVSLSAPLLTARQEESLNPLVITVQSVENLPDRPLSFEQLHRLCHPVYTRFAFLDQPASRHKARLSLIQQRNLRFDSRHVILTGLHDEDELRDFFLHSKLVVELHDRDKKGSGNDEKLALVQSFGVARFSLAELVAGATLLSMTASVVPSDSGAVLGAKHSIAPGFYLECDTLVKIKIESRCSIFGFGDTANNISRAVFVIPHSRFEMVERILELVQGTNIAALDLDSVEQLIETKMSKEQRRSTTLDMMTGFLVTDQGTSVLFLEGCIHIGMTRLLHLIESLDMEGITQYFDLQLSYSSRIWAGLSPNVAWIHLPKPLDELMREPRVFVRNKFPRPAFQALRNCQDVCNFIFVLSNAEPDTEIATDCTPHVCHDL
ncbi:hypothetical protein BC828DRAFT_173760 [Blastocladiella britannica]|nr:hypothetical protein BC828DRAFT_173760 [Blastocladiella britannica]